MPCTDPIADFLTVVRNASKAKKDKVTVPASNTTVKLAEILKEEGFIDNVKVFTEEHRKLIRIHLKYMRDGKKAIQGIRRVSKPGRRLYSAVDEIPRVQGGLGIAIISTPKGIITDRQARKQNVGGEVMCTVW